MWLALAFVSAFFLGCYDICKKKSVHENAVIPVLFLNTFFCSLLLLPLVLISTFSPDILSGTIGYVPSVSLETHGYIFIKSVIVLTSWIFGYFAIKHNFHHLLMHKLHKIKCPNLYLFHAIAYK